MYGLTFRTLALLTVVCCGSSLRGQAQTPLPPPANDDPQSPGAVTLELGPQGVRVTTNEDQAEQLRDQISKGSVGVVSRELHLTPAVENGKPVIRIVCRRAVFCTHHGLEGRADVLQFDGDATLRLLDAELIVDRYRDDPPDRISAKEIILDLDDLGMRLNGVCTQEPAAKEPSAQDAVPSGREPRERPTIGCTDAPRPL